MSAQPTLEEKRALARRPVRPLIRPGNPVAMLLARALVRLAGRLGHRGRERIAKAVGQVAYLLGIRRAVTLDNLRRGLPELSEARRRQIARGAYVNMSLAALEAVAGNAIAARDDVLRLENAEPFLEQVRQGRPALMVSAHFGNWELIGDAMRRLGIEISAVVRPLEGALNAAIVENRLRSGVELIPARGAIRGTLEALKRGRAVGILLDQVVPAHQAVFVPFFGRPAATSPLAALVALRTGAPLFVVMGVREGPLIRAHFEGPLALPSTGDRDRDVQALTAEMTARIERYIRLHPEQWMWLHRRWKVQPPASSSGDRGTGGPTCP